MAGLWWMTTVSSGPVQHITALVYGLSLFFLFTVSTTFHALAYSRRFTYVRQLHSHAVPWHLVTGASLVQRSHEGPPCTANVCYAKHTVRSCCKLQ